METHSGLAVLLDLVDRHERVLTDLTQRVEMLDRSIHRINSVLDEMTRHNEARDRAIAELGRQTHHHVETLAEMTRHNAQRDDAIAHLQRR